jgi:phosphate uptake regulator
MEIRKVQISGGSSYIVSLPKKWIKSTNIQKNDPVGLIVQQDGTLLITPNTNGEQLQKRKEFVVSANTDEATLLRYLIGAYIAGYTTITIRARARLPPFVLILVRNFTGMAIGQEVVEETETSITIKDLLNPSEMPFESTIRRMAVIVRGMQEDAVSALLSNETALAESVISRDNDVDRLHWLIARQHNLIQNDVNLSRKMDIPVSLATNYFLISRIIERIADHATRIAHHAIPLIGHGTSENKELMELIDRANRQSLEVFLMSMNAFYDEDIEHANRIIGRVPPLEELCRTISTRALAYEAETAIHIVYVSDSVRRIGDYSADICESIINHLVGVEQ